MQIRLAFSFSIKHHFFCLFFLLFYQKRFPLVPSSGSKSYTKSYRFFLISFYAVDATNWRVTAIFELMANTLGTYGIHGTHGLGPCLLCVGEHRTRADCQARCNGSPCVAIKKYSEPTVYVSYKSRHRSIVGRREKRFTFNRIALSSPVRVTWRYTWT